MTDRDLLEAAARAAGINVHCGRGWQSETLFREIPNPKNVLSANVEWNPLTDDGDALRLAVTLEIHITNFSTYAWASTHGFDATEPLDKDACAATRRAIVRVAAEIGKHGTP
jgi:hypothetical protein